MQENNLYDIYDFYTLPWWQEPWILGVAATGVIIAAIALWFIFKRKRLITPWDAALQQLHNLSPEHFVRKAEFKQFYFALTSIIKTYVDARYGWSTKAKTDDELVAWLEHKHPEHPCTAAMKTMIENMLLIKFANVDAIKSQAIQDKQAITDLIKKTIPTS